MTRPLRRAHARIWLLLSVLLPAILLAALAVRRTPTPNNPHLNWEQYR
jgi:hypothetical protein